MLILYQYNALVVFLEQYDCQTIEFKKILCIVLG